MKIDFNNTLLGKIMFIKCNIFCPLDIHIPILSNKINGKLLAVSCAKCAELKSKDVLHNDNCMHSDAERS